MMKKKLFGTIVGLGLLMSIEMGVSNIYSVVCAEEVDTQSTNLIADQSYYIKDIFPDEKFRGIIIKYLQALSIPVNEEGMVKQDELNKIRRISEYYSYSIKTLEGAQYLKNLESISLIHTNIQSLSPLENLSKLSNISITHSDVNDVSALNKLSKNDVTHMNISLRNNKITDFSFIPEIAENLSRFKFLDKSLDVTEQYVSVEYDTPIESLPVTVPMPNILLHDGNKLNYETLSTGHFENGDFLLEKLGSHKLYFSESVAKIYNDSIKYGVSITIKTPNNHLFPKGINQDFIINVNETFDFSSPFRDVESGYSRYFSYDVNEEELDVNKPGVYELNYQLIKFNNRLEPIPFRVSVKVLPVTYYVDFKLDNEWEESYSRVATNSDMTVVPPKQLPEKDGYIFEGWAFGNDNNSQLVNFDDTIRMDTTFFAKWRKDKPQGEYIKDGQYVTVVKAGKGTWSNFDGDLKRDAQEVFKKTFEARGRYEHRNGQTYYSLYNEKGQWQGYIDSENTKIASGKQGTYISENTYVTVIQKGYNTWSNFSWKKKAPNNLVINKTFLAKGKYNHINGSTYYSIYDEKNKWQGYISANGVKVGKGKQGVFINKTRRVSVTNKKYNTWSNFNWKKKYQGHYLTDSYYESRGMYYHINGTRYHSLYNKNGLWQGYINEKSLRLK